MKRQAVVFAADVNSATFTTTHILATAALTGMLALVVAAWRLPAVMRLDQVAVGMLTFGATEVLRQAANMPALNDDGFKEFSANDCLAPAFTYVVLSVYADLRGPADARRYAQVRALATLIALAVNVITI
jgi:hypothetical protein